jgi:hypothetical protein
VQVAVDKIELDIQVLSLINDHYANIQQKKEQERQAALIKQARTNLKAPPITMVSAASSASSPNKAGRRKVLSEAECRTQCTLLAVCKDGSTHVRPLCNSSDVLLALHELLDPTIFLYGCVQLPHVLADTFARHREGYYRYTYTVAHGGQWQYYR